MKQSRYLIAVYFLLILTTSLFAQNNDEKMRTLLGNDHKLEHGGWGAPTLAYSKILDQDAMLVGIRGGWIIDHRLTIGLAGYGLVTEVNNAAYDEYLVEQGRPGERKSRFQTGYGGLLIEPVISYSSPIHISLPIIIGAGGYGYTTSYDIHDLEGDPYLHFEDAHSYFVLEPGIDLEINVIPLLRLGLGASYRYTSDLKLAATPTDGLQGWNASMSIKIGVF